TLEQFGEKLGITRQGTRRIEISEASGTISINLLKEAGKAINMKLVYGFIPMDNSLESMIEERARKLAEMIVTRSSIQMNLEDQGVSEESIKRSIDDMIYDYKREVPKILWDLSE
ncbi:MAG: XRE family transcriptional regulator, partial [Cyclobacteriaceae bacterium]|nr:XRE family transcriptional regulator [Cyclobacteriaceae bacterium]